MGRDMETEFQEPSMPGYKALTHGETTFNFIVYGLWFLGRDGPSGGGAGPG